MAWTTVKTSKILDGFHMYGEYLYVSISVYIIDLCITQRRHAVSSIVYK